MLLKQGTGKWKKMGTKHLEMKSLIGLGFKKFCSHFSFPRFPFHALVTSQFHVVVVQWRQRNEQQQQKIKRDARAKLLFG